MAANAFDNVFSFPDGGRFPTLPGGRILAESRDLMARRLREALRAMLEKVAEDLLQKGDAASDREQRNHFYRLRDALNEKGGRLEAQLAAHWTREFDAAVAGRKPEAVAELHLEDLQIVDDNVLTEELSLKSLASRLDSHCEDELYAIGRRFAELRGEQDKGDRDNPAAPSVFAKALDGALQNLDFDAPSRLTLLQCLEPMVGERLAPIYHEVNGHLVRNGVLPNLRRGYGKSSGFSPSKPTQDVPSGDLFALLQKLVATPGGSAPANPSAGALPAAGASPLATFGQPAFAGGGLTMPANPGDMSCGVPGGMVGGAPGGVPVPGGTQVGVPGGMPGVATGGVPMVPMDRVWASLDALQHSIPVQMAVPAGSMPVGSLPLVAANVLHDFRSSDVGQGLGQLDAITVDIVAMLFDMIFDDRSVSDPIKALVGKLQIPVLKVAMLDKSFFSSKAHPTRRLLDTISRAAVRWGRDVGHDDPIYRKIAEIIDRVHTEFQQDTALFDTLCSELEQFLVAQEADDDVRAARAAPLVFQREQEEIAALAVEEALRPWLSADLPPAVVDLLGHEWRRLLLQIRRETGGVSEAWEAAVKAGADLVDSVHNRPDVQTRRDLARSLPCLVKQISAGFDKIGVEADRRHQLFDGLFSLHAAVLRGAEPLAEPSAASESALPALEAIPVEPTIACSELADGEVTVESISLATPITEEVADLRVEGLQRGDWVEMHQADGSSVRYRLSWVSPQRGIYLFTNPQSPRALAISPEALALQVQRGEVSIVQVEPIFDRAVTRALEALQAA